VPAGVCVSHQTELSITANEEHRASRLGGRGRGGGCRCFGGHRVGLESLSSFHFCQTPLSSSSSRPAGRYSRNFSAAFRRASNLLGELGVFRLLTAQNLWIPSYTPEATVILGGGTVNTNPLGDYGGVTGNSGHTFTAWRKTLRNPMS